MKTVVILHGITGHAGINWQQWLHDRLVERKWKVIMPSLPHQDHPDRKEWLETIRFLVRGMSVSDLLFIGHSLGVVSALDYIEQLQEGRVLGLVAVSGFCSDYGAKLNSYFLREKRIDFEKVNVHLEKAVVVYGDNDPYVPQGKLRGLARKLRVAPTVVPSGGHLNLEAGYTELPLLFKVAGKLLA